MYTMEDHTRDGRKYPACSCGAVWLQRGNRTGHCTKCHETWEGSSLFDAHQSTVDGVTICADPTEMLVRGQQLRLIDGSWRGPGMSEAAIEARRSSRTTDDASEA